jgi:hypothetical protein
MPQVYADSQKLRTFAREIRDFANAVDEQMSGLRHGVGRLGETWRDGEYDDFVNRLTSAQHHLRKFVEEVKRTAPLLERDADAIDELVRQKPGE